ncbi:DUF402 domain-containing protein [Actinomycetaceae bacterium MB13-C1-2]|nr:DUF402 domain-containing protein [Actinomycetaceae bacterium MB13-C1-2]
MRIVRSEPAGVLVAVSLGSEMLRVHIPNQLHLRDIPPSNRPAGGYAMVEGEWRMGNALVFFPFNEQYSVWSTYDGDANFSGWYVNLEEHSFVDGAIVVTDYELDVLIDIDRQVAFKDEESFREKTGTERYWGVSEAERIYGVAEDIAASASRADCPFDEPMVHFPPEFATARMLGEVLLPTDLAQISMKVER